MSIWEREVRSGLLAFLGGVVSGGSWDSDLASALPNDACVLGGGFFGLIEALKAGDEIASNSVGSVTDAGICRICSPFVGLG